jgi:hypothetical protein
MSYQTLQHRPVRINGRLLHKQLRCSAGRIEDDDVVSQDVEMDDIGI